MDPNDQNTSSTRRDINRIQAVGLSYRSAVSVPSFGVRIAPFFLLTAELVAGHQACPPVFASIYG